VGLSGRSRIAANETTNETAAESGRLTLTSSTAETLLGLTRGELARKAGHAAPRRHRLARRRGKRRALVAVGNSILVIAHRLLSGPAARFSDLGPDWHDRIAPLRRKRQLITELERLSGKKVLLQETAA
jgi:hypothetical protein